MCVPQLSLRKTTHGGLTHSENAVNECLVLAAVCTTKNVCCRTFVFVERLEHAIRRGAGDAKVVDDVATDAELQFAITLP